jgi:hypothetical protein
LKQKQQSKKRSFFHKVEKYANSMGQQSTKILK